MNNYKLKLKNIIYNTIQVRECLGSNLANYVQGLYTETIHLCWEKLKNYY